MHRTPRRRVSSLSLLLSASVCSLVAACGSAPAGPACPLVSSTCPSRAPSYAEVAPIIQARCVSCHSPTGVEPNRPYETYAELTAPGVQIDILTQLRDCKMPLPGTPSLSENERATLLAWLYCDAPLDGGTPASDH